MKHKDSWKPEPLNRAPEATDENQTKVYTEDDLKFLKKMADLSGIESLPPKPKPSESE